MESLTLLSKCLKPLPEKFHGLTDTDLRYRQRYLDMVVNPEVRDTFVKRSQIISAMREFLDARGFLEVETPVLHTQAAAPPRAPLLPITIRWISICICASRWSCTSSA